MTRLFDRKIKVTIGDSAGRGIDIDERFRISFSVELFNDSTPNTIRAELYNLSENTRNQIRSQGKVILIEAGYKGSVETLAIGEIRKEFGVVISREPPDTITIIEAQDGLTSLSETKLALSFDEGYPVRQALQQAARATGLPLRFAPGVFITESYRSGAAFSGSAKTVINQIVQRLSDDFEWTVQEGAIIVYRKGQPVELSLVTLGPQTGLLRSPQFFQGDDTGWTFESLLNPKIRPGVALLSQSRIASGRFIAKRVRHSGDTRANDWITVVDAVEPG